MQKTEELETEMQGLFGDLADSIRRANDAAAAGDEGRAEAILREVLYAQDVLIAGTLQAMRDDRMVFARQVLTQIADHKEIEQAINRLLDPTSQPNIADRALLAVTVLAAVALGQALGPSLKIVPDEEEEPNEIDVPDDLGEM